MRNLGRGSLGACGGVRRRDGSGRGLGNLGTSRQPKKKIDKISNRLFSASKKVDERFNKITKKVMRG